MLQQDTDSEGYPVESIVDVEKEQEQQQQQEQLARLGNRGAACRALRHLAELGGSSVVLPVALPIVNACFAASDPLQVGAELYCTDLYFLLWLRVWME